MKTITDTKGFEWGWCGMCEKPYVNCPECGNNCCNGGTGDKDGKPCGCDKAYTHQSSFFFRPYVKSDFEE